MQAVFTHITLEEFQKLPVEAMKVLADEMTGHRFKMKLSISQKIDRVFITLDDMQ